MADWLREFYDHVDRGGLDAVAELVTDDLEFRIANSPAIRGREAVIEAERAFLTTIAAHTHEFVEVFNDGDTTVLEAVVTYTRLDGTALDVPCATVLRRRGDLVASIHVYLDDCAVFASPSRTPRSDTAGAGAPA